MNKLIMTHQNNKTAIINAVIFDGHERLAPQTIVFENGIITQLGGDIPVDAYRIDGTGATLLPGLIDAHVHTSIDGLRDALQFGVTTELEMAGGFTREGPQHPIERDYRRRRRSISRIGANGSWWSSR